MHSAKTYYQNSLKRSCQFPRLDAGIETDTCILGGGFAGLMTQLGLLERGHHDVVLLERSHIGAGASGRNGGFVFAGYSLSPQHIVQQVGAHSARELYHYTVSAVDLIRQRIMDFDIDCDLVDDGVIWANWFKNQDRLHRMQDFMRTEFNVDWEYWSPEHLRTKIRSDRYHGALFEPKAMHFHPLKYAQGIAGKIHQLGGRIFENNEVTAICPQQDHVLVTLGQISVKCRQLVICAGGYMGKLFPRVSSAVLPIATYIMVSKPLPPHCHDHLFTRAAVYDTRFAFDYYRPLLDDCLLWGGRISAVTSTPRKLEQRLRRDLARVFPALADIEVDYVWDGWMAYARHQMPCIGWLNGNIYYNLGYGGHGVGPTTVGGEMIAAAIAEGDDRYRQFSPWALSWAGGKFGALAAQATYWWYQGKDWFDEWRGV